MGSILRKKVLVTMGLILLTILIVSGLIFSIYYMKENNYLFYATGTKHKAFKNSTWEMSPNEIQRANKTILGKKVYDGSELRLFTLSQLENPKWGDSYTNRIDFSRDNIIRLWGKYCRVVYGFFDNKLYVYEISIPLHESSETERIWGVEEQEKDIQLVVENLKNRFGTNFQKKDFETWSKLEWNAEFQHVILRLPIAGEENNRITIRFFYFPMTDYIQKKLEEDRAKLKKQQSEYF